MGNALLREGVEYHLAYVQTESPYLVYKFLHDYYACVSVQGVSQDELRNRAAAVLSDHRGINGEALRKFLMSLARSHRVVVGAKP